MDDAVHFFAAVIFVGICFTSSVGIPVMHDKNVSSQVRGSGEGDEEPGAEGVGAGVGTEVLLPLGCCVVGFGLGVVLPDFGLGSDVFGAGGGHWCCCCC